MYTKHFGLSEDPFTIAANPRFLYMSEHHREALAHLLYGIRNDSGFVLLTGEVGTGKTTVCRCLIEQLTEQTNVAFILNPKVTVNELLGSICDELGVRYEHIDQSIKTFVDAINLKLLEQHALGRGTVVIIDEAQNLSIDVLEQLRLLTNLETNERKLMRIILIGQPELEAILSRPELKQVEQRITARYNLTPLDRNEIHAYVSHRLAVAGCREPVFPSRLVNKLYAKTRGVPRLINIVCDRAMLGAYVKSKHKVNTSILQKAAREVKGRSRRQGWLIKSSIAASSLLVVAVAMSALIYSNREQGFIKTALEINQPAEVIESTPEVENLGIVSPKETQVLPADIPVWPEQAIATENSLASAQQRQFQQWGITLKKSSRDPCLEAVSRGLRCYSGTGNLGTLRSINRPVILTLVDSTGKEYRANLISLKAGLAVVAFAHGEETVTVQDLEARWKGQYQLFWRAPQNTTVFRPGDIGPQVGWLTRGLLATGLESLQVSNQFDSSVIDAVKKFQRSQGLIADGIAGRQTIIHLNSVIDKSVPRLSDQVSG